jgi:hypothetical protein
MNNKLKVLNHQKKEQYISSFLQNIQKRIEFKNKLKFKNNNTKEEFKMIADDPYAFIKQDYNWLVFNSIGLEQKYSKNDDYASLFITLTLNSQFHTHMQTKTDKIIKNKKYVEGNTINLSYKILNEFFTSIYRNFKVNGKFEKTEYLRAIEPDKASFCPHLHAVIFLRKKIVDKFITYLKNKIKNNTNLGKQYDIKKLDKAEQSSAYLLKYLDKNYKDEEMQQAYYGWRWQNKIRAYTFSKTYLNREIFDKISFHFIKNFYKDDEVVEYFDTNNLYKMISMFTSINIQTFDVETGEVVDSKKEAMEDNLFVVNIKRERQIIDDVYIQKVENLKSLTMYLDTKIIISQLKNDKLYNSFKYFVFDITNFNDLNIENDEFFVLLNQFLDELRSQKRYLYKVKSYEIYKKAPDNIARYDKVYDKRDWELIES